MDDQIPQISATARSAVQNQDWATVDACANQILLQDQSSPEGHFLSGIVLKVSNMPAKAAQAFETALALDENRYDAAVELAYQYAIARRNGDALALLAKYKEKLHNSPMYLDLAGTTYTDIGMTKSAWPLYKKATQLQPGVDLFQSNLAACGVHLGKIDEARTIYRSLLDRFPGHRRNHYQLSRLGKAEDKTHVEEMNEILRASDESPDKNIFLYYAIGKELEDLEEWQESFEFYKKGGDAVTRVANYDVAEDVEVIDKIIECCDADWLAREEEPTTSAESDKTPIFIVGLPRTGTTLTERIISSHSQVASLGETQFLQMVIRRESGVQSVKNINPEMIDVVASKEIRPIAEGYLETVRYRLGDEPMFIEKLPFNFLFLGFIAKAYPQAPIIHLKRHPMDTCFAMYKQVFTWAYKFSYTLEGLGQYYVAYNRLYNHWKHVLGDRLIEIEYEELVADQEGQTRALLDRVGLDFEDACLNFDQNIGASATASSVQVRQKIHSRSVNRWKRFEKHLQPLKQHLESAGIDVD